jgi:hypothetical protein
VKRTRSAAVFCQPRFLPVENRKRNPRERGGAGSAPRGVVDDLLPRGLVAAPRAGVGGWLVGGERALRGQRRRHLARSRAPVGTVRSKASKCRWCAGLQKTASRHKRDEPILGYLRWIDLIRNDRARSGRARGLLHGRPARPCTVHSGLRFCESRHFDCPLPCYLLTGQLDGGGNSRSGCRADLPLGAVWTAGGRSVLPPHRRLERAAGRARRAAIA